MPKRIIYDVGAGDGRDIPYYLMKAHTVVAIEANPVLCDTMRKRFHAEIETGRVVVEECVVVRDQSVKRVPFFISKQSDVLSSAVPPASEDHHRYEQADRPACTIREIVERHGQPYYVKIDVEFLDREILESLFEAGITPPFLSAEAHSLDVVHTMMERDEYRCFNVVNGRVVHVQYESASVTTLGGHQARYEFPLHSAGPFGEDIDGAWMGPRDFLRYVEAILSSRSGWLDVHASTVLKPVAMGPEHHFRITWERMKSYAASKVPDPMVRMASFVGRSFLKARGLEP